MNDGKKENLTAPRAPQKIRRVKIHGVELEDAYYWLRDKDDPGVVEYLKAENAYTARKMKDAEAFQKELYHEMLGRIKEDDVSVPVKIDDYFYYFRTEKGKPYRIYCRKKSTLEAKEEIILDANELAAGQKYFHLGTFSISPDHRYLAYSQDTDGSEDYTLFVRDLENCRDLDDVIGHTSPGAEWSNDGEVLLYVLLDNTKRPYLLKSHRLAEDTSFDKTLYEETDGAFFLSISKTKDKKYFLIELESKITTETRVAPADGEPGSFEIIEPRREGLEYYIEHHREAFVILTNHQAINFRLMKTFASTAGIENWQEMIPHEADVKLEAMDVFEDYLAIYERHKGTHKIRILDLRGGGTHYLAFDEAAYALWGEENPLFSSSVMRFGYSSLVCPPSIFDYDVKTKSRKLLKEAEIKGGYDRTLYKTERLYAPSTDGREVPASIAYRSDCFKQDGTNPLFLYGYGSYGISTDPSFSSNRISLLDRGFVYAIAHVRGGGDLGRPWYEEGKFLHKKNTFHDYIAVCEYLIEKGYASAGKIACYGGSAGGLLMGAAANMRPELFSVMILDVPFVDVINTMLDETIPLTITEYEEWGNPKEKVYFDYMLSYSPYDNIKRQKYPHMLVTGGISDPRVQYWEPAKWTAKLRAHKMDNNDLLLKINMDSGHGGPSGRYEALKEVAYEYAFLLSRLKAPES